MRVQLSSGEAKVRVFFGTHDDGRRTTTIQIDQADGTHIERVALCSKRDQFNRRVGRKVALQRVLEPVPAHPDPGPGGIIQLNDKEFHAVCHTGHLTLSELLNRAVFTFPLKADRHALWQAVCPDFYRATRNGHKESV